MITVIVHGFKRDSELLEILTEIFANEMTPLLGFASVILERRRKWIQM